MRGSIYTRCCPEHCKLEHTHTAGGASISFLFFFPLLLGLVAKVVGEILLFGCVYGEVSFYPVSKAHYLFQDLGE